MPFRCITPASRMLRTTMLTARPSGIPTNTPRTANASITKPGVAAHDGGREGCNAIRCSRRRAVFSGGGQRHRSGDGRPAACDSHAVEGTDAAARFGTIRAGASRVIVAYAAIDRVERDLPGRLRIRVHGQREYCWSVARMRGCSGRCDGCLSRRAVRRFRLSPRAAWALTAHQAALPPARREFNVSQSESRNEKRGYANIA